MAEQRGTEDTSFDRRDLPALRGWYTEYTPLNVSPKEVFTQIQDNIKLERPLKMNSAKHGRSKDKYCNFHEGCRHDMNDCYNLKVRIDELIQRRKAHEVCS